MTKTDIRKLAEHWRDSSLNDWRIFQKLKRRGDVPQALFFIHLSLEKIFNKRKSRILEKKAKVIIKFFDQQH